MPCLESSEMTLSVDGGLRPKGKGNHGLFIASFTTLSMTSSPYNNNSTSICHNNAMHMHGSRIC